MEEEPKTIQVFGTTLNVVPVEVKKAEEPSSEYELSDGSVLRVKSILTEVMKLHNQRDPVSGHPLYLVRTNPVVTVIKSTKS
jgi:hypothetical protein